MNLMSSLDEIINPVPSDRTTRIRDETDFRSDCQYHLRKRVGASFNRRVIN